MSAKTKRLVAPADIPVRLRPADKCFSCGRRLGEPHEDDCVIPPPMVPEHGWPPTWVGHFAVDYFEEVDRLVNLDQPAERQS